MSEEHSERVSEVLGRPTIERLIEEASLQGTALFDFLHPRVDALALYGREGVQALIHMDEAAGKEPPREAIRSMRGMQDCACMKADVHVPQ